MQMRCYGTNILGQRNLDTILVSCLTNGSEDKFHWCAVVAPSCCGPSSQADAVCLSLTALDARYRELIHTSTLLWDVQWFTVYQVANLYTNDGTNKGLWVPPHQEGGTEPGEDHLQGWGVGDCKGCYMYRSNERDVEEVRTCMQ